jgi:hypothetical protein
MHGIAYEYWFDKNGHPITPLALAGMTYNFSSCLAEDFTEDATQLVLEWSDEKTVFYKGLAVIEDELVYIDTTVMKSKPYLYYGKLAIPVVDYEGNTVIYRGVNGTKAQNHKAKRYCRSVVNMTQHTLSVSYSDNAELSESKQFSPVVSSGTVSIDIEPIEWGNKELNGEPNIYKLYEMVNRTPVYCFVGTRTEQVCEFVAFSSSFNIMPTKQKMEVRISDKTSLYWSEELKKTYQFTDVPLTEVLAVIFDYDESMIRYPNSAYTDDHFMTVSYVNTNDYSTYRDFMQELSKELMFRFSFDSNECIVLQSELLLMSKADYPNKYDEMLDKQEYYSLTDLDNIFDIERSTSSNILYNKLDTEIVEHKAFYDGSFFKLESDEGGVYLANDYSTALALAQSFVAGNTSHDRFIYDVSSAKLYMACYTYSSSDTQTYGLKQIKVNNSDTCTIEEARNYKSPIRYMYSKRLADVKILDTSIDDSELVFNTIIVSLPRAEAELLDPYGRENGEYVVLFDGLHDFHARVIDISTKNQDYYDVTIAFGYDKDYNYNFQGKTDYLSKIKNGDYYISYANPHNFVMYYVRKELPYVWEYSRGDKTTNTVTPILGNETFEVYMGFGGIDTDDGTFSGLIEDIGDIYDQVYYPSFQNEYSQHSPVYLRAMMYGQYVTDGIDSMYIHEFDNKNLIMQILRSKPTEDLPKNSLITGMTTKNNGSSDGYVRITSLGYGNRIRLNIPLTLDDVTYPTGYKFTTINYLSDEAKKAGVSQVDLFDYYIVKIEGKAYKVYKDFAETIPTDEYYRFDFDYALSTTLLVSQSVFGKVNSGDIIVISEPTETEKQDPEVLLLWHKYKDSRWIVKSKLQENGENILFLDYEFPSQLKFGVYKGYVSGNVLMSGYSMLQSIAIKGNPILEYKQRYYYENSESVAKYGDKAYSGFSGKLMPSIDYINQAVSYIINGFAGLTEQNQKMVIPITTSHIIGLDMLDTVRVTDRVYGTYDKLGVLVGKDFSVDSSSGVRYNLKVFTMEQYESSAFGAINSVSKYQPIEFPVFGYKDGDGGWESTGTSITKNDARVGEVKFKTVDQSLFSVTTSQSFYDTKEIKLTLKSPTEDELSNKDFAEIFTVGTNIIVEYEGYKHLVQITELNRNTETLVGDVKLKYLFEDTFDNPVTIPSGEILGLYQTITVLDEISSIVDRVELIEEETEENFGTNGVLSSTKPAKPLNFRVEPAVNGFVVKLTHPDSANIKGYNIHYTMISRIVEDSDGNITEVAPDDNVEKTMFTSATLTFVSGVGKRKYEVWLESVSHKGVVSDPTIILQVETKVLGFDDVYYEPGQSPDELDAARKELATLLGSQIDKLEQADEYLRGQYGTITEDLNENYYSKTETDSMLSLEFGKVEQSIAQTKHELTTALEITNGQLSSTITSNDERYTILGGEIDWAKSQINQTVEGLTSLTESTNVKIEGLTKEINEASSKFEQTAEEITTTVENLKTEMTEFETEIKKETTEINQTATNIQLSASRLETKVENQALVGCNYLYNSGEFIIDTNAKTPDHPIYWSNSNEYTAYPCSVVEDTDGSNYIFIPHTEGIEHDGVYLAGGTTYYCSATLRCSTPIQSTEFEPISLWISRLDEPTIEGSYGEDYELSVLGTHMEEVVVTNEDGSKRTTVREVDDTFPIIQKDEWTVVKVKLTLKGSTANKVRVVPRIKLGEVTSSKQIRLKNIQLREGVEYKAWEPSLEQAIDPVNIVSLINITPDEIKLDSKLIKVGGGLIVEGENVAVNNLSAKRLQLGDSLYYTDPETDDNGNVIPDTEKLIIKKVSIGVIEALNPQIPDYIDEENSLISYIDRLDASVSAKAEENLQAAKDTLNDSIGVVKAIADNSKELLDGMASDSVLTPQEKVSVYQQYVELKNRVLTVIETVKKKRGGYARVSLETEQSLYGKVEIDKLYQYIIGTDTEDSNPDSLAYYLNNSADVSTTDPNAAMMKVTTTIDPNTFNSKWETAYATEELILQQIKDVLEELAELAKDAADTAQDAADKAQASAQGAAIAVNKAELNAQHSMESISAVSDDNFLSAAEKIQMYTTWVELRDSAYAIQRQVEASNYKSQIKTLNLLNDKIVGETEGSLYTYLNSSATNFFLTDDITLREIDVFQVSTTGELDQNGDLIGSSETVKVEVAGTELKAIEGSTETGGERFDRMWQEAYNARQTVLEEIAKVTDERLTDATADALISLYGQYDPFFRRAENTGNSTADTCSLPLHTFTEDGESVSKIESAAGLYYITGDVQGLRVNGIDAAKNRKILWKNVVEIDSMIHYRVSAKCYPLAVYKDITIGVVCLDENYKSIGLVSLTTSNVPTNNWSELGFYITALTDSQNTTYRFTKGTKYVRPYFVVVDQTKGQTVVFESLEFVSAQDEINQSNISDIFSDNKLTPDEKLELERTLAEMQAQKEKIDTVVNSTMFKPSFIASDGQPKPGTSYEAYVNAYNACVKELTKWISTTQDIVDVTDTERIYINNVIATYYSTKETLQGDMSDVIKSSAVSESTAYTDERADDIQNAIDEGYIVLNSHTKCYGDFVVQSGATVDSNGKPVWSKTSDYTRIAGGRIEFWRPASGGNRLLSKLGPCTQGTATMSYDSTNSAKPYNAKVSFPDFQTNRTIVIPSLTRFDVTSNVRSVEANAECINTTTNTWLLYVSAIEEDYAIMTQSFSGKTKSYQSYGLSVTECDLSSVNSSEFSTYDTSTHYVDMTGYWYQQLNTPHLDVTIKVKDTYGTTVSSVTTSVPLYFEIDKTKYIDKPRTIFCKLLDSNMYTNTRGASLVTNRYDNKTVEISYSFGQNKINYLAEYLESLGGVPNDEVWFFVPEHNYPETENKHKCWWARFRIGECINLITPYSTVELTMSEKVSTPAAGGKISYTVLEESEYTYSSPV